MSEPLYRYPGATNPETYDLENRIADPDGHLDAFIVSQAPLAGMRVLDIGAGGGWHAVRMATEAEHVFAAEPDPDMLRQLHARLAHPGSPSNVSVLACGAESIPLPDDAVDRIHARFAYFFGTDAMRPGVAELKRVLRPGGVAFVIDNYTERGLFGQLCRVAYPTWSARDAQRAGIALFAELGFEHHTVDTCWRAPTRADLHRVMAMEFPEHVDALMARVPDREISYGCSVFVYRAPSSAHGGGRTA